MSSILEAWLKDWRQGAELDRLLVGPYMDLLVFFGSLKQFNRRAEDGVACAV